MLRPVLALLLLVSVLGLAGGDAVGIWRADWQRGGYALDFITYYGPAWMLRHGDARVYQEPVFAQACLQATRGQRTSQGLFQPPPFIWLSQPLAGLDFFLAADLFKWVNLALLGASVLLVLAVPPRAPPWAVLLWLGLAYTWSPGFITTLEGQINVLVLFCLSLFLACELRGWSAAAGLALTGAVLGKVVPVVLLVPLVLQRRYRTVQSCLGALLLLTLVTACLWPTLVVDYLQVLGRSSKVQLGPTSQSLVSVLLRWFTPNAGDPYGRALLGEHPGLAAFGYPLSLLTWGSLLLLRKQPLERQLSLWILALGFAVPYNWLHHHTMQLAGLLLAARWLRGPLEVPFYLLVALLGLLDGYPNFGNPWLDYPRYFYSLYGGGCWTLVALFVVLALSRSACESA